MVNLSLDMVQLRSSGTLDKAIALATVGCRLALVVLAATVLQLQLHGSVAAELVCGLSTMNCGFARQSWNQLWLRASLGSFRLTAFLLFGKTGKNGSHAKFIRADRENECTLFLY
jgi:hypothetical protein